MEVSIEDMIFNFLFGRELTKLEEEQIKALTHEIQNLIDSKVKLALKEFTTESIVVTQRNIFDMVGFTGMSIDSGSFSEEEMETEYTIETNMAIAMDDDAKTIYKGLSIHIAEYPEEGSLPLNLNKDEE